MHIVSVTIIAHSSFCNFVHLAKSELIFQNLKSLLSTTIHTFQVKTLLFIILKHICSSGASEQCIHQITRPPCPGLGVLDLGQQCQFRCSNSVSFFLFSRTQLVQFVYIVLTILPPYCSDSRAENPINTNNHRHIVVSFSPVTHTGLICFKPTKPTLCTTKHKVFFHYAGSKSQDHPRWPRLTQNVLQGDCVRSPCENESDGLFSIFGTMTFEKESDCLFGGLL